MNPGQDAPPLTPAVEHAPVTTRRRLLGALATGGVAALAGCSSAAIGSPTTISWLGEDSDADGLERHLRFTEATVFTIRQLDLPPTETVRPTPIPFSLVLHHREGLRTDRLRLRLLAPPADGSVFTAAIYLRSPPNTWWPALSVSREEGGWTNITAAGLGQSTLGEGPGVANVRLDVVVVPTPAHPATDLFVGIDAELSEPSPLGRRRYRLARETRFPMVTATTGART